MALLEIVLVTLFLGGIALSVSYYFTQHRVILASSSQVTGCQSIVKQALEDVVSLGTRLHGYRINNNEADLKYNPLFIKADSGNNIVDVGDGSYLGRAVSKFPPQIYQNMFKNILGATVSSVSPEDNSGVPLVTLNTNPLEIGTSVLLVNSVNALQYLYNSDSAYFDVADSSDPNEWLGKQYSNLSSGLVSEMLKRYGEQFNLEDIKFYVRIVPVNLQTGELIKSYSDIKCQRTTYDGTSFSFQDYTCPTDSGHTLVLTRPRLINPAQLYIKEQIPKDLFLIGNENLGFEIKVHLEYKHNEQEFSCDAMHRFNHQNKTITGNLAKNNPLSVEITRLENGTGKDLLNNTWKQTSCDTDGSGYKNITLDLNFKNFNRVGNSGEEFGTLLLCKGKLACRSDTEDSYGSCRLKETDWQRCHTLKFPAQVGNTDARLLADDKLSLTFNDLKENRRYDFFIKEVSMLEWSENSVKLDPNNSKANIGIDNIKMIRFYIDATRPAINSYSMEDEDVGTPVDGTNGRNYSGPPTSWSRPSGSLSNWLQCNSSDVTFKSNITDQFIHNLKPCVYEASRRDGVDTKDTTSDISNILFHPDDRQCEATLSSIDHGRQTIKTKPFDTCGVGSTNKELVWDTDLPSTFQSPGFSAGWKYSSEKISYTFNAQVPATGRGTFPKHYSVDCVDAQYGSFTRTDGNGGSIACDLLYGNADLDDGCNPEKIGVNYYHVCGGGSLCEEDKWAVYAPYKESCKNVQCEPGMICCDGFRNECGTVAKDECERDQYPHECSNPKGGGRSQQDSGSGCPPLGLYNCHYNIPCEATTPFATTGPTSVCVGKRQGNSCSFPLGGTCDAIAATGHYENSPSSAGRCIIRGQDVGSCSANVSSYCDSGHYEDYDCNCRTVSRVRTCSTCTRWVCDDTDYILSDGSCSRTFSGSCGVPSGGCPRLGVGGGNLSQEKCIVRYPTCGVDNISSTCAKCSATNAHQCDAGNFDTGLGDTGASYRWNCLGDPNQKGVCGSIEVSCSRPKGTPPNTPITPIPPPDEKKTYNNLNPSSPIDGACAVHAPWYCQSGSSASVPQTNNSDGSSSWTCQGSNGGSDASCSRGGVSCGSDYACSGGTATNYQESGNRATWTCRGTYGGDSVSCSRSLKRRVRKINGACAPDKHGGCARGNKVGSGSSWTCQGINGGSNASCGSGFRDRINSNKPPCKRRRVEPECKTTHWCVTHGAQSRGLPCAGGCVARAGYSVCD